MLINELFNSNSEPVIEGVLDNPGQEDSPVASAIIRRILLQRTDLLAKYGPERVGAAVDDVADSVGDWDEIGSSDVSGWVRRVEQMLGDITEGDIGQLEKDIAAAPVEPIANMEAQEKIGGRHDADDFDDMVLRLKKLAGSGPMKTVWDPARRQYRNMPTAVQPPQQPKK